MVNAVSVKSRVKPTTVPTSAEARREQLVHRILQRIEHRLPGRIRQLAVYATEHAIVLSGRCSTYYTKQVAQHTAMGVLEYERLINNIDVDVPK
jgi:uncharacterized protein YgbK (DUF1537 family)